MRIRTSLLIIILLLAFSLPTVLLPHVAYSGFPYRDYDPFITAFMRLAQTHSQLVTYQTVGSTVLGKDIIMFMIGNPYGGRVLFDGALHGTEAIGSELLYSYAKWLLESNDTVAEDILRTTCTLLIPVVNADKENYARKNANGVDLNRNFAAGWSRSGSTNSTSDQYRGPTALSEPESQTLVQVFATFKPSFYVNLHMWADPYYAGCRYANATYYSTLVGKIAALSRARGVTPFRYAGGFEGAGMAIGDAARAGITSFLMELTRDVIPILEVQTGLLARFIPVASVLSQEARPPVRYDHDVALTNLIPSKTVLSKGATLLLDVQVADTGRNPEAFNLTVNANGTLLAKIGVSLLPAETRSFMVAWNTSTASYGSYVISASVDQVLGETNVMNNNVTGVRVWVTTFGDLTGPSGLPDGKTDIRDVGLVAKHFGEAVPPADKNLDLYENLIIDMRDVSLVAKHFGEMALDP